MRMRYRLGAAGAYRGLIFARRKSLPEREIGDRSDAEGRYDTLLDYLWDRYSSSCTAPRGIGSTGMAKKKVVPEPSRLSTHTRPP